MERNEAWATRTTAGHRLGEEGYGSPGLLHCCEPRAILHHPDYTSLCPYSSGRRKHFTHSGKGVCTRGCIQRTPRRRKGSRGEAEKVQAEEMTSPKRKRGRELRSPGLRNFLEPFAVALDARAA